MKATKVLTVALATLLIPAAAHAVKIPLPIEGATLNLSFQLQTQFLMQENGAANGNDNSYDIFIRRSRLLVNGDINQNFSYLIQIDNPNYGKKGNFNGRGIIQDAWVGWAPTGITGGTVFYVDAGLLLIPFSHNGLESTTNFITADIQTDSLRGLNAGSLTGLRDTGVQIRGWALDKRIGFRGGIYEGIRLASGPDAGKTPGNTLSPKSNPQFAGFINFDIIGSEEGGWLYGAYKWGKDPILSIGGSALYQSQALRKLGDVAGVLGIADQQLISGDVYLNLPMTEAAELVAEATVYFNRNGSNSVDTGIGGFGDIGYRFGAIAPYVGYEFFSADSCDTTNLSIAQCAPLAGTKGDSRNFKVGLNFFFNKNFNHVNAEFTINHGQSKDAAANTTLAAVNTKSFLLHWNNIF